VNIAELMGTINLTDVLVVTGLFAFFILGWIQGAIRRLVGIASMTFSFFIAAQLSVPFGTFLADNWRQFPREYSVMLGFLTLFVAAVGAFTLVIQGTYRKAEIFARHPIVDEVVGGLLGVLQGGMLLMFLTIVLDQFFRYANLRVDAGEVPFLREFWTAINRSGTGSMLHQTVIPGFLGLTSFLVPQSILAGYGLA
jgi:uncharacterized membrane protein required for colicin V production